MSAAQFRETRNLEFKQEVSKTFLKTVSAYANYGDGEIWFGVSDDGQIRGLENPTKDALVIEQMVNSTLEPVPDYSIEIKGDNTIKLVVHNGPFTPYLCRGKAYRRSDSSTVEVGRLEYNQLVLRGLNRSFEELSSNNQELEFSILEKELIEKLAVKELSTDVLKTLQLRSDEHGFNNAAALLADHNDYPGLDYARFGETINEIRNREELSGVSVLQQIRRINEIFREHYTYERVQGAQRERVELIPEEAFREVVANAVVHRRWDIPGSILVRMYPEKIEVSSPGSLPEGVTIEEYLGGYLSLPRNPILAGVFFRLGYIEKFGTGIIRIKHAYKDSILQPQFTVRPSSVTVTLPVIVDTGTLSVEESQILDVLGTEPTSRAAIQSAVGLSKDITIRALNTLIDMGAVEKLGSGPSVTYRRG